MIIKPGISALEKCVEDGCRYILVTMAAKRARMLSEENEEIYTDYKNICDKPVSLAVHEIAEGKVEIVNEK